jgi:hypothetical protein
VTLTPGVRLATRPTVDDVRDEDADQAPVLVVEDAAR